MAVSYAMSTYRKSKQFHEKLQELQKTIKPITIRTYLAAEGILRDENVELNLELEYHHFATMTKIMVLIKT